jgi:predicted nucleic acid-binding protein
MNDSENSGIPRRIIDTNIIIRYLTRDIPERAIKACRLFMQAQDNEFVLLIPEVVFVEVIHVLTKIYHLEKSSVINSLRGLIKIPGVETVTPYNTIIQALANYESTNAPWPDALIAAHAAQQEPPEVYSFDTHLDKFGGIVKLEP